MADRRRRAGDWRLAGLPEAVGTPEYVESEERTMPNGHQPRRGPVPMSDVIKKTLSGIAKAQRDYEAWSGGLWLWEAPEYMLTTYIAKELWTIPGSKYLTLESNVRRTLEDAGGMGKGRISEAAREDGRSDIMLWWSSNDMPRAVIEVKNQVSDSATEIKQDIKRISTRLLHKQPPAHVKRRRSVLREHVEALFPGFRCCSWRGRICRLGESCARHIG